MTTREGQTRKLGRGRRRSCPVVVALLLVLGVVTRAHRIRSRAPIITSGAGRFFLRVAPHVVGRGGGGVSTVGAGAHFFFSSSGYGRQGVIAVMNLGLVAARCYLPFDNVHLRTGGRSGRGRRWEHHRQRQGHGRRGAARESSLSRRRFEHKRLRMLLLENGIVHGHMNGMPCRNNLVGGCLLFRAGKAGGRLPLLLGGGSQPSELGGGSGTSLGSRRTCRQGPHGTRRSLAISHSGIGSRKRRRLLLLHVGTVNARRSGGGPSARGDRGRWRWYAEVGDYGGKLGISCVRAASVIAGGCGRGWQTK